MFARNGDVEIAYEDLGGAGGDPLLLVMGLGASRFWWPPGFSHALVGAGFHVVAYDHRDAGESSRLPETSVRNPFVALAGGGRPVYSSEDMTDDAVAVLDALGWDSAHLFGHSMGGLLAQRIALRRPGRVRSLTSSGALPSDVGRLQMLRYLRFGTVFRLARMRFPEGHDGDVAAGVALARAIASPGYPFDEPAARAMAERELAACGVSGIRDNRAQSRQIGVTWSGGRLAGLRVPALVLHGEDDQIGRPAAGRATARAIRDSTLVVLAGVGHDLPSGVWPRVAREVRAVADRAGPRVEGCSPVNRSSPGPHSWGIRTLVSGKRGSPPGGG
ncbi:alpha/beta fold hydrolase [Pseudonocardia xinjiangensis]|uniref:Alpha/beta hydrolase n=1 Tax=Pseudonocardia xinjiangensis TaxID=75289 RepID=A0ABX1RN61_9PSEU|nr:alpha/beta fold hydrolase [Pseudonocardia xinjiangensis]NMH81823.1 alpha/beta hydrolase [Pseudonocardia xinjiangensis]